MVRVDIETIVMAAGPVPSLIVLRERCSKSDSPAPLRSLSIQTGSFEAAAISRGIDSGRAERPIAHDLLLDTLDAMDAKLERIEIVRAEPPVFYATVVVLAGGSEHRIDARPSDAIALAVRSNAPMFVEDDIMNRLGTVSPVAEEIDDEQEFEKFDEFVHTLSPDDFRRMMNQMKGGAPTKSTQAATPASPVPAPTVPAEQNTDGAPLAANSKFTFENFVYGPENSHAYRSALKFAALADERGTCTSLFIYGKSGLGKTHLLLAIKNELAEKSPEIKVKYANSQAYLDDLMTEFDRQKKSNAPIMQAYHGVDVLIIDDIQNIIGKRASVDYFFQLMDEFIRNNKKVVIAADRAPKDLSMDERLTSRFNAGMLCLVAEPSYEMKYKILQRYYENTIAAAPEAGDDSLLAAYGGDGGHLTDEHFKHLAEVSGTNIRELESFCERCAGEAGDREREGSELSFDDIDAIASQYFDTSAKKINVQTVQSVIEEQYGVTHEELIGPRRNANIAKARHIAIYLAIEMCEMTTTAVGAEFGNRNHSTVSTSYKKVQKMIQEDRAVTEDLKSLRDKITLRS